MVVGRAAQTRANSFNFIRTERSVAWTADAESCRACEAGPDIPVPRQLWLTEATDLVLHLSDTGDFDLAEIARIKDQLSHVFLDRSPPGVLDDFTAGMRRLLPDPVCQTCSRRADCGRRFRVVEGPPFAREEAWIASYLQGLRGSVLDVGCGEQLYRDTIRSLLRSGTIRYTGIDPDEISLDRARKAIPEGQFQRADVESFQAEPGAYDHVLCLRAVNHIADLGAAMARMRAWLKPDGKLLLVECTPFAMLRTRAQVEAADRAPRAGHQHFHNLASEDLMPIARRSGLSVVEHQPASRPTTNEWILLLERAEMPSDRATSSAPLQRQLDSRVENLLAPLLHPRSPTPAVQVLSWDVEQGISLYVKVEGRVLLIEIEPRNDELACFDRTARFNVCARINFQHADALTDTERRLVTAVVRMIRNREHLLPAVDRPPATRRNEVREILVERVLFREGNGNYYLNPYVGCMIGCEFCYVAQRADLSWAMQGLPEMAWGHRLEVKVNAPEVLRRELRENQPGVVRMSPILTDPYQPVERKFRITRRCLEAMVDSGFAPFLLTRAVRALEDLELLCRFPRAALGFSIPTNEDRYRQMIEPGADPVEERLQALERFAQAGLFTAVVIQPMMPMDVDAFVRRLGPVVKAVRIDRMQFPERIRHLYQRHQIEYALEPGWAADTEARLIEGFRAYGVAIDEHDDLVGFLRAASV